MSLVIDIYNVMFASQPVGEVRHGMLVVSVTNSNSILEFWAQVKPKAYATQYTLQRRHKERHQRRHTGSVFSGVWLGISITSSISISL